LSSTVTPLTHLASVSKGSTGTGVD